MPVKVRYPILWEGSQWGLSGATNAKGGEGTFGKDGGKHVIEVCTVHWLELRKLQRAPCAAGAPQSPFHTPRSSWRLSHGIVRIAEPRILLLMKSLNYETLGLKGYKVSYKIES